VIEAGSFIAAASERGFGLYTGVPCSYLTPFINHVINAASLRYVGAANEGDAVAIAAGAELGGVPGVVMFPELRARQRGQSADLTDLDFPHPGAGDRHLAR
jgi:hypothetical protein